MLMFRLLACVVLAAWVIRALLLVLCGLSDGWTRGSSCLCERGLCVGVLRWL